MLSTLVKQQFEKRLGYEVRYPSDCERMSLDIFEATRQHIGVTTLKRLFGFVKGTSTPRMSTLDVLARYLGFRNYDELVISLDPDKDALRPAIEQLSATDVETGTNLTLGFAGGLVELQCVGTSLFRVKSCTERCLQADDNVTIHSFRVGSPLYVHRIVRGGRTLAGCVVAKVFGLDRIERSQG